MTRAVFAVGVLMVAACSSYSSTSPAPPTNLTGTWTLVVNGSTCACNQVAMTLVEANDKTLDGQWRMGTNGVASDSGLVAGTDSATTFTIGMSGTWGNQFGTATKTSASRLRIAINNDTLILARQ